MLITGKYKRTDLFVLEISVFYYNIKFQRETGRDRERQTGRDRQRQRDRDRPRQIVLGNF